MSDYILKRKSRNKLVPISGKGKDGFSINGGYRNKGCVGDTNLAISYNRTIYKGIYPVGKGGTDGKFVQNIISNVNRSTNDPNIIKRSTMTACGLNLSRNVYPTSVFTNCKSSVVRNWVKDFNTLNYSQGMFIQMLKVKNLCPHWLDCKVNPETCHVQCTSKFNGHPNTKINANISSCSGNTHFISSKKIVSNPISSNIHYGALSSGEYTNTFLYARQCLPTPPCKQHFPPTIMKTGCDINYTTPSEAIAGGILPSNWGSCSQLNQCENHQTHCVFNINPYTCIPT